MDAAKGASILGFVGFAGSIIPLSMFFGSQEKGTLPYRLGNCLYKAGKKVGDYTKGIYRENVEEIIDEEETERKKNEIEVKRLEDELRLGYKALAEVNKTLGREKSEKEIGTEDQIKGLFPNATPDQIREYETYLEAGLESAQEIEGSHYNNLEVVVGKEKNCSIH